MSFPPHIAVVLDNYGVQPSTKAALYDLYASLGSEVLEQFAELANGVDVKTIEPDDLSSLRATVVERFLRKNHPLWGRGTATPSLWHPRVLEGRVSGIVRPIGELNDDPEDDFSSAVVSLVRNALPPDQPVPNGTLLLGKNAHFGGRFETVSFDVVTNDLDAAIAAALSAGQQHTLPGSIGETSGTADMVSKLFLVWEIQPNVYKPSEARNSGISKLWRRHRNWHIATLSAAVMWGLRHDLDMFVLRGEYLAVAHEVNAAKPVTDAIIALHNRTVEAVASALGAALAPPTAAEVRRLVEAELPNRALTAFVEKEGGTDVFWRFEVPDGTVSH